MSDRIELTREQLLALVGGVAANPVFSGDTSTHEDLVDDLMRDPVGALKAIQSPHLR